MVMVSSQIPSVNCKLFKTQAQICVCVYIYIYIYFFFFKFISMLTLIKTKKPNLFLQVSWNLILVFPCISHLVPLQPNISQEMKWIILFCSLMDGACLDTGPSWERSLFWFCEYTLIFTPSFPLQYELERNASQT